MKSTTQTIAERLPSLGIAVNDERAVDHAEEPCAICGGTTARGVPIDTFISDSLTDQNTFRAPSSSHVCAACAFVRGRFSPVLHRPPQACDVCDGSGKQPEGGKQKKNRAAREAGAACQKCEGSGRKETGGRYGNFSHFIDDERLENASKGEKPKIVGWLRGPKSGWWSCCVADSGQKHLLPYTPRNPPGSRGRIRFEEQEIALPPPEAWEAFDDASELLTAGATKEELETGQYSARAWTLCGEAVRRFEDAHGRRLRGGAWFALVVWLAQRDEARVAARVDAEKTAKKGKADGDKTGRRGKGKTQDVPRGDAPRVANPVPPNDGGEHAGTLADPARQDADRGEDIGQRGRVGDVRDASTPGASAGQLGLFDVPRAERVDPRAGRVARDESAARP